MDNQALHEIENLKTVAKFDKQQDRIIRNAGYGETEAGLAVAQNCMEPLVERIQQAFDDSTNRQPTENALVSVIRDLPVELVAFCTLRTLLHAIGKRETLLEASLACGEALANECWAAKLTKDDPKLAEQIANRVKRQSAHVASRQKAARAMAEREGFRMRWWDEAARVAAGGWCIDMAMQANPLVFETITIPPVDGEELSGQTLIGITDLGQDWVDKAVHQCIRRSWVYQPMLEQPAPWTSLRRGGPVDPVNPPPVVRSRHRATEAAVSAAIRSGQMQPALDGLNALQAVAFTINQPILDVINWCARTKQDVGGMPAWKDMPIPSLPANYDEMEWPEKKLVNERVQLAKVRNLGFRGDRIMFKEDMETAERLTGVERFYTPMNLDWRARVYGLTHFNFQRDDRVRALFLFADGEPIGEEGLWWLKVHVANCGDFGKISKRPLEERVAWVDTHIALIQEVAADPIGSLSTWRQADKPFLFLAAALELSTAIAVGPTFISTLPVSFDGSCSGLQHLCAMTRAPEGALVNLTDNSAPADVYQTVADRVLVKLKADAELADADAAVFEIKKKGEVVQTLRSNFLASTWLTYTVDRKVVKRNVMTFAYSSKKFGMSQQHEVDLMKPLRYEVLDGKRNAHPFGSSEKEQGVAARYLAGHVYETIKDTVRLPAEAMAYLQKIARALAHEGKPVQWTTPAGLPWINRYHEPVITRISVWLSERGVDGRKVRKRHMMTVATGDQREIAKDRAANGVAPNFVHALDAAHLLLVARASACAGITQMATVHDSFGCLASRAGAFNRIIREVFVRMYTDHDVLAEVLEQAKHDLTPPNWQRLPSGLTYGSLQLNEVLNARYAFA